jgi:hypothetical protein
MFRRIVLGQQAGEGDEDAAAGEEVVEEEEEGEEAMSPSPGDEPLSPQDTKSSGGGLASVFKGLAGAAKLTKSPPTSLQSPGPFINAQIAEQLNTVPAASRDLPAQHLASFELLQNGSLQERIAAANALRWAVADYPLNPVSFPDTTSHRCVADQGTDRCSISGTLPRT